MNRKLAMVGAVFTLATGAAMSSLPAAAAPASPGACNMLHVSPRGMDGMFKASKQGLDNMMELVIASEASDCPR